MPDTSWLAFFSGLASAEQAAAEQCRFIAAAFEKEQRFDLAKTYNQFAEEESGHFQLIRSLVDGELQTTERAKAIYSGSLLRNPECVLERIAVVHLAFEPSALAFLGHIYLNAHRFFTQSEEQIEKIKLSLGTILKEEVGHIMHGRELVSELLKTADKKTVANVRRSLRLHKAFLSLGLKSFFEDDSETGLFIDSMLQNYQVRFDNLTQGIA